MANTSAERDLIRAKDIRKELKGIRDASARRDFEEAANRLERRAAKKIRKVGKASRRRLVNASNV